MRAAGPPRFPTLLDAAESDSAEKQRWFYWATGMQLGLLAAAAVTAVLPNHRAGNVGPISTLALFLAAFGLQAFGLANKAERGWYDARAAAESIKSAAWEYAVGGESYRLEDSDAETRFLDVLRAVLSSLSLSFGATSSAEAGVTESMRALRAADRATRMEAYRLHRIDDQVDWYGRKATWNKKRSGWFGAAATVVEAAAVLIGILRVNGSLDADYLSALAAIAAGFVGWSQAKKYAALAEAYSVTSQEAALVAASLDYTASEAEWAQTVHDAEAAFSREHTMWQARRQGPM